MPHMYLLTHMQHTLHTKAFKLYCMILKLVMMTIDRHYYQSIIIIDGHHRHRPRDGDGDCDGV